MNTRVHDHLVGLQLFLAFLVGRFPVHSVRLWMYRKVFKIRIGRNTSFHWRAAFFSPQGLTIGNHSIIGNDAFLDARRGIQIGDSVNIGGHVQIFTLEHDPQDSLFGIKGGPVSIGNHAYIATRATILPDVTIGAGAVVAAGAVVTKDVAEYTIVGGIPARKIGERRRDLEYELDYHLPFQ